MKDYKKYLLFFVLLAISNAVIAATDWTDYLGSMENNCNGVEEIADDLKNNTLSGYLKSSVASRTIKDNLELGDLHGMGLYIYKLKNAIYRGYDLDRIELNNEWASFEVSIYFKNNNFFANLKPKFMFGDRWRREKVGTENFWVVSPASKVINMPYSKFPKNELGWTRLARIYPETSQEGSVIYKTDKNGGSRHDIHDDENAVVYYLSFKRANKSIMCGNAWTY